MSKSYNIAVLPGDGTGPEVVSEGIKVLNAAADKAGFSLNLNSFDFGGDRYLKTGEVLPDSAADDLKKYDAIFLGAIGHPDVKPGILEKGILLRLRFEPILNWSRRRFIKSAYTNSGTAQTVRWIILR